MTLTASRPAPVRTGPRHRWLPGVDPRSARLTAESALLGVVVGAAVVAPWTREGYLLLLDWVAGPHQAITPGLYGLDPAALDALPYRLITHALRSVVGAGATSWLIIFAYFPIVASGVSALAAGGRRRRHPAALFACCNPFVVERIQAGHVAFLLSVALLSWLLASAVRARRRDRWFAARPAGWYALAMAVGPHAAWLGGVALLAVTLLPRPRKRDLLRMGFVVAAAGCIYSYAVALLLSAILTVRVGGQDLEVYAPHAGPGGLLATLVSLRGFWRGAADSSPQVALGFIPAAVMVLAAVAGLARLCRRGPVAGAPLAALAVVGVLLGAGIHGPLGGAYRTAFDVLPLFAAMREQQKWVALTMLAYAVGIGVAVEALYGVCRSARPLAARLPAAGSLVAVAGVYAVVAPSLVWGLGGSVTVSRYPESWYAADKIMGSGTESVLFLPWHEYQPFGFTGNRTVATPAGAFFRRPVISSDAVELGPVRTNSMSRRMAYVQRLVAAGGAGAFGRLVAPLGVRYVVLARERETDEYGWLAAQPDLRQVLRTPDLGVYRVEARGTGRVVGARGGGYDDALRLAARGALGTEAVLPGGAAREPLPSAASGGIRRLSSTSWRVEAGKPGWVVIPEEWSTGWSAGNRPTRATAAGTVAIDAGESAVTVRYTPWRWLRIGLAASLLSVTVLVAAGLVEHRRELWHWWWGDAPQVRRPRRPERSTRRGRSRPAHAARRERRPSPGTDRSGADGRR
ncbi:hypothetical protein COUCH_25650 [Couchioplanes caeruleus]|uniref:hypothetical protein n=1 Tax=Couchioplanes caeruleus TaxID=56438 RepID=UPI0020BFAEB9|nr:hypothetical protein [Couchioplanes caeruleus]UQU62406.1 hypothetical protein COUCH_25650 [Couchioplanes caeruleus]